jgi:hypothetical protein
MIVIIMIGENFVAHLDGLGGTPVCRGTPVAHHWYRWLFIGSSSALVAILYHVIIILFKE